MHVLSCVFKRLSIAHTVEDGAPFLLDRNFRIYNKPCPCGGAPRCFDYGVPLQACILINGTFTDPQVMLPFRERGADANRCAASSTEEPHEGNLGYMLFGYTIFKYTMFSEEESSSANSCSLFTFSSSSDQLDASKGSTYCTNIVSGSAYKFDIHWVI